MPWLFGGTAAFLALMAVFTAWYTVGASTFGMRVSVDFSLWGGCWAGGMGIGMPCGSMGGPGPFNTTNAMLPSLVCAVVSFLLYLGSAVMGYARKMTPRAAGVLSLMAAASSMIAPIALMASLGPALAGEDFGGLGNGFQPIGPAVSFWGSTSQVGGFMPMTIDWGPGAGWYLSVIAAFFGAIAGLSAVTGRPGSVPIRPPTPYMQPMVFAPMPYGAPPGYGYPPAYPPPAYGYGYGYGAPPGYAAPPSYAAPQAYGPTPAPTSPAMVFCPSCGTANAADAKMCASCFSALGA